MSSEVERLNLSSILRTKAKEFKEAGKIEHALTLLSKAAMIESGRKPENYWRDNGICFCEIGRYEEAIECFDKDIELNRESYETYYAKGVALYVLELFEEALECLYKAYEINYADRLKVEAQVDSLRNHKKFENILKFYNGRKNISKPGDYLFWYYLGLVQYHLGKYHEAAVNFERSSNLKTESVVLYEWAKCELMLNNEEKCLRLLETARIIDPAISMALRIDPAFYVLTNKDRFRILLDHQTILS